jgi:hypothetical protein
MTSTAIIAAPSAALDDRVAAALHATTAFAVADSNSPAGQRAFRLWASSGDELGVE